MDKNAEEPYFSDILKKLEEKINYHDNNRVKHKPNFLNRINLDGFKVTQEKYINDRSLCKKVLKIEGKLRLDVGYGPLFETTLPTERAGKITVQTDELILMGGGGTAVHPTSLCMVGFGGCFSAAYAKWAAMEGIKLDTLKIKPKANVDLTNILGIDDNIPLVDDFQIDLFIESDASFNKLREVLKMTEDRCFCSYCIRTPIFPKVILRKEINHHSLLENKNKKKSIQKSNKLLNRINIEGFKKIQEECIKQRSLCKKTLELEGEWRLNVEYGPQYEAILPTELAGNIMVQTDETIILGGGGTSFHPVHL
ncbi:MAG: OsmC family protein, partial [Candidatus Lokiarchaeota archaeon]|nr:OsmC family protein [Candidatus Lokiarchaeota archaeon]